jgi:hypothetical protein
MIDTVSFTAASGMRPVEGGRTPGSSGVALVAWRTRKQAGVERWVGMAGEAGRGETREDLIGMAFRTGQPGMCTG